MRYLLLLLALPVLLVVGLSRKNSDATLPAYPTLPASVIAERNEAIGCGDSHDVGRIDTAANGKYMVPLPGWGHYSLPVSTHSDSAQFYFDQGLNMYYSFHLKEANASFHEAARFDPHCAMAYWGQALSMGPYYNDAVSYKMKPEVIQVVRQMNSDRVVASPKEKILLDAMTSRYSEDTTDAQRASLNQAYADKLKKMMALYPDDPDIHLLYIDAEMTIHAWDFWNTDGSPKKWTPAVVGLCKSILDKHPDHPAALHYYIHLTEASRHPEVALAAADRLKDLMPGVAHMVHMSSHEYERNGLFAKGIKVNDLADNNLMTYDSLAKVAHLIRHSSHYFAVQSYCALSGGMYEQGMLSALRCRASVSPSYQKTYHQELYMMPELLMVRLGKWNAILADTVHVNASWPDALCILHFARGMAFVHTQHPDSAMHELRQLQIKSQDSILLQREIPFSSPYRRVHIAAAILEASLLMYEKKNAAAEKLLEQAVKIEDSLIYAEPKDWMIPARQFLGALLLKQGKPVAAEKVYRQDLVMNPGNGWSLLGLSQSLLAQHKIAGAAVYTRKYKEAFASAEQIPLASVYMDNQ